MRLRSGETAGQLLAVGALVAALASLPLVGCSERVENEGTEGGLGPVPDQITVSMRDNFFQQRVDTVALGGTVTWPNDGNVAHTSTSDAGIWDSGTVDPGETFSRQFTQAGTFPYFCRFHGQAGGVGMAGTVVVR